MSRMSKQMRKFRNHRIDELHSRLEAAVADANMHLAEPEKRQGEALASYWNRMQTAANDKNVILLKCTHQFQSAFENYSDWLHCGVILLLRGQAHFLNIHNAQEEVASMRVLLAKDPEEALQCSVCQDAQLDIACRRCWAGMCRSCFASCAIHGSNLESWSCPKCRITSPMECMVNSIPHETRCLNTTKAFGVIKGIMRELGVSKTTLTVHALKFANVEDDEMDDEDWCSGDSSTEHVQEHLVITQVKISKNRVFIQNQDWRPIANLLHTPGTTLVIGDIPHKCSCCQDIVSAGKHIQGDWTKKGRVLFVERGGRLSERVDMFGCFTATVRSWLDRVSGDSSISDEEA